MRNCENCIHNDSCAYFDFFDASKTEEKNMAEHCEGCCCGDGWECNKVNKCGCMNWEDGSGPILG